MRALDKTGAPRTDIEELQEGDRFIVNTAGRKQSYTVGIKRYELINLALNPNPANIKVSSFRVSTSGEKAFNGISTGTSGSGFQVEGSQANMPGKETFWLAVDLGEEREINSFGVAWGTSVANLRKRLKDGTYRVEYTNDTEKWKKLSNATEGGKNGFADYSKPSGWKLAYTQNTNDLPDANGNKVFNSPDFASPVKARYVMVTGELANSFIEIYNLFVFQKKLTDGKKPQPIYPTEDLARIKPDCEGMTLAVGRPAIIRRTTQSPAFHITAPEDIAVTGKLLDPNGKKIFDAKTINIKKGESRKLSPKVKANIAGTYKMIFTISGSKTVYDTYYFTAVNEDISDYNYHKPYYAVYPENDRLIYVPDYRGNTVPDYSNVGYKGGGISIPNVPVKIILEPAVDKEYDDTERIQNAINTLGRIEPCENGFRGAVLLKAGTYRVSSSIRIDKSGIVIKGEGDGHEKIKKHKIGRAHV